MDPQFNTIPKKSLWRERDRHVWSFFCPMCRAQRKVPFRSRPGGFGHYSKVALTTAFFMLVTWKWFAWKGVVAFLPFWAIFEVSYRGRTRAALGCPQCGFDPYLYLTDIKRARAEIENHWRRKFAEKGIPFPEKDKPAAFNAPDLVNGEEKQQPEP